MVSVTAMTCNIQKTYSPSYYSGMWFNGLTFNVAVWGEVVEHYEEKVELKRQDYPRSKKNWKNGMKTKIVDLNRINSAITITGFLTDPTEIHTWEQTTLNGAVLGIDTTITLTDASTFPSSGMIMVGDEYIYYTGKSTNDLTGCQRGFFNTVASAHNDTTAVYNRTDGAICKYALLDFMEKHGGTVYLYWRNRKFEVFMNKFQINDSKRESDGLSMEPTMYPITINCFEGELQ